MASYANFINAEVQSHYANETYVNSLDKYSSLKLKFLPSNFFFLIFWYKIKKKKWQGLFDKFAKLFFNQRNLFLHC